MTTISPPRTCMTHTCNLPTRPTIPFTNCPSILDWNPGSANSVVLARRYALTAPKCRRHPFGDQPERKYPICSLLLLLVGPVHIQAKKYRPSWFDVPHEPRGSERRLLHAAARLTSASKRLPSVPTCISAHGPPRLLSSDPHRFMMMLQESVMQSSGWGYAPVQRDILLLDG